MEAGRQEAAKKREKERIQDLKEYEQTLTRQNPDLQSSEPESSAPKEEAGTN